MTKNKRCIFHIPNNVRIIGDSGSQIRPLKMLQAFKNIGYEVDVVMGYGRERKSSIKRIKGNIQNGIKYDFVYSESSTMPTLLTEPSHIPIYIDLDFGFLAFCKKNNIPIGLFYRDIHWKFPAYKQHVKGVKRIVATAAYKYDLKRYTRLLDYMYCPSKKMKNYIPTDTFSCSCQFEVLPSGAVYDENEIQKQENKFSTIMEDSSNKIKLFYVGGIIGIYKLEELLKGIRNLEFIELTICCRKFEWEKVKSGYEKLLTNNVTIIHESGQALEKYYNEAHIGIAYFQPSDYMNMAMPVKIFEYIGHTLPILGTQNTAFGDFIKDNQIGWSVKYDATEVKKLMVYLNDNFEEIVRKHHNVVNILKANTWEQRAIKVKNQLTLCRSGDNV